ncbi:MAG: hypothetical protein ABSB61_01410 [Anaerolineales bacterium]
MRLNLVARRFLGRFSTADGVQQTVQRSGLLALPERGKRRGSLGGGMGVLRGVFAHARQVAPDLTGVARPRS